ncbi:hypothetical protein BV22DRAFT_1035305 [Leucogyrophana mollusca]|uniref:Uncharacterized protein n=1 Tax=Leucogyrophana mollusca TaxID=85980 RepID=A0ACB8BET4_9AGAM|nr:hypothetical protein BV22DRAFT_1035305 [Leucogyrophana mollusca]
MGLESCTNEVQVAQPFELGGRSVVLIDTPGFDDTTKSDTDVLKMIAAHLVTRYSQGVKLSGVIYMQRISDFKMGGASRRDFQMFQELCGEESYQNVVICTNMWNSVNKDDAEAREEELRSKDIFFKPILDKGAQLHRHDNSLESAQTILRGLIAKSLTVLRIQHELVDEWKDITQSAAFAELNRELMDQAERHRQELNTLWVEMEAAAQAQDEETRIELQEEAEQMEAELLRVQTEAQRLASEYEAELKRVEYEVRERERR